MRFGWIDAACIVAIAIAALQVQPGERSARLFTPPSFAAPGLKSWLVADSARTENERIGDDKRGNGRDTVR
jgi:hypothetical protein